MLKKTTFLVVVLLLASFASVGCKEKNVNDEEIAKVSGATSGKTPRDRGGPSEPGLAEPNAGLPMPGNKGK